MADRHRKSNKLLNPPAIKLDAAENGENEKDDTLAEMLPATRKRSRKLSRTTIEPPNVQHPKWSRKLSVSHVLAMDTWSSSSKYAMEAEVPEEWLKMQELLEDCRHNFSAVHDPTEADEWKYLRSNESMQSWEKNFGLQTTEDGQTKVDDASRAWLADDKEGFVEAEIIEKNEKQCKIIVKSSIEPIVVETALLQEPNPSTYDGCEDMAMLSFLNEASILHNLRERFKHNLIHTYSGLFCITINPWRWLPIYSHKIVLLYKGQSMNTMPPHIYAMSDNVYNSMIEGQEDQSILITGESGAGKTENTKKIIQYFTVVAAQKFVVNDISLEEQICESNPVLEAFGNAKSAHNDNSSRFGKFIRICFTPNGKVCKALIESYLLEKSRIVSQAMNERSYHIFYQLLSNASPLALKELLHLEQAVSEYRYLQQGVTSIEGVDDANEMEHTERSLYILNFTNEERLNMYRMVAAVLNLGQMRFRAKSRNDDQATIESFIEPEWVCELLGLTCQKFVGDLCEPVVVVRGENVKQGKTVPQVNFSVAALGKAIYEKMFRWLVKRTNMTLGRKSGNSGAIWHFIGILDIAGFEIFDVIIRVLEKAYTDSYSLLLRITHSVLLKYYLLPSSINSFEQLCINYTNEKLQYFFNHQMFVREQEEYRLEGLNWDMIDFALDLKPTIDLIEMPMGVLSMLEEECIMPKGNDMTFLDKMMHYHEKKSAPFDRPKGGAKIDAHFSLCHYAGMVNYNVEGWIEKNKDPLNTSVINLFKNSDNALLTEIWNYYGTTGFQSDEQEQKAAIPGVRQAPGQKKPQQKGGRRGSFSFLTVSSIFKQQLSNLIAILNSTNPHFVRCVVPNYERKPGIINGPLVLKQLRCNGVLEGLRIVARGFPNRLRYEEFRNRFRIMNPEKADWHEDSKNASVEICETIGLHLTKDFEVGQTKIFFRVGVLGRLELMRTAKLNLVITALQAQVRSYLVKHKWKLNELLGEYITRIQRAVRWWIRLRDWPWFQLMLLVKPAVRSSVHLLKHRMEILEKDKDDLKKKLEEALKEQDRLRAENEKNMDNQSKLDELTRLLEEERKKRKKADEHNVELKNEVDTTHNKLEEKTIENQKKDEEINILKDKLAQLQKDLEEMSKKPTTQDGSNNTDSVIIFKDIEEMLDSDLLQKMGILDRMLELVEKYGSKDASGKGFTNRKGKGYQKNLKGKNLFDMLAQQQDEEERKRLEEEERMRKEEEAKKRPLTDEEREQLMNKRPEEMTLQELRELAAGCQDMMKKKENTIKDLEKLLNDQKKRESEKDEMLNKMKSVANDLEDRLRKMQQQLEAEAEKNRKREMELNKLQRNLEEISKMKSVKEHQMSSLVEELQKQIQEMNRMIQRKNEEIKETRNNYDKMLALIRELQAAIAMLEQSLQEEKAERRNLQRILNDLRADYEDMSDHIARVLLKLDAKMRENQLKDNEISRLQDKIDKMSLIYDEQIRDLKERHASIIEQLHEKIEILHRKALKLETENQQMKAQIYNEPISPLEARRVTRSSSNQLAKAVERTERTSTESASPRRIVMRQLSTGVDCVSRQLDSLEREKQELMQDKRLMRLEIENFVKTQDKETEERGKLHKQLKEAQLDISKLNRRISAETDEKIKLSKDIRQLRNEFGLQEQKTTKILIEKDAEVEGERLRALLKTNEATSESSQAIGRLSLLERLCATLHEEVEEYKRRMEQAERTVRDLEEKLGIHREKAQSTLDDKNENRYED